MDHELNEFQEKETNVTVISPVIITASYVLVLVSIFLQIFFALSLFVPIYYFFLFEAQVALFLIGTIIIIVILDRMVKTEKIRKNQKRKLVVSSVFLLLSALVFIAAVLTSLFGMEFTHNIANSHYIIVDWNFVLYMFFLLLQGAFQLIGHTLFNSAMKETHGKTKFALGAKISTYILGGFLGIQMLAMILLAKSSLLLVTLYLFGCSYAAITIACGVIYSIERKMILQLLTQQKIEIEKIVEKTPQRDIQRSIPQQIEKTLVVIALLFIGRYAVNIIVNVIVVAVEAATKLIFFNVAQAIYLTIVIVMLVMTLRDLKNKLQGHSMKLLTAIILLIVIMPLKLVIGVVGAFVVGDYAQSLGFEGGYFLTALIYGTAFILGEALPMAIILFCLGSMFYENKEQKTWPKLMLASGIIVSLSFLGQCAWLIITVVMIIQDYYTIFAGIAIVFGIGGLLGFLGMYYTVKQQKKIENNQKT